MATAREIRITLPKEIHHHETKAMGRRMKHQTITPTSFVMSLIGYECPKHSKLAALVMEEERQEEEGKIT